MQFCKLSGRYHESKKFNEQLFFLIKFKLRVEFRSVETIRHLVHVKTALLKTSHLDDVAVDLDRSHTNLY